MAVAVLLFFCTTSRTACADLWFNDSFDDSSINQTCWNYGGDGVSVSSGMLHLVRNGVPWQSHLPSDDYIQTVSTYSGDFDINLDIRLNRITASDQCHGITVKDDTGRWGYGISLGFTTYDSLYFGQFGSDGNSLGYSYYGSNNTGEWQHWTIEKRGAQALAFVNGEFMHQGTMPDNVRVSLPGWYSSSGDVWQPTSSDVDNFSITYVTPAPEPCTFVLLGIAAVGLFAWQRRRQAA
jgi:hypothetical protein